MAYVWDAKHPSETRTYYLIMCSDDATNDGTSSDDGELQGRTVSSATVAEQDTSDLTLGAVTTAAVSVNGTSYAINTVVGIPVTGGTEGATYTLQFAVTLSDAAVVYEERDLRVRVR